MNLRKMSSLGYYAAVVPLSTILIAEILAKISIKQTGAYQALDKGDIEITSYMVFAPIILLTAIAYRFGDNKTSKIIAVCGLILLAFTYWYTMIKYGKKYPDYRNRNQSYE